MTINKINDMRPGRHKSAVTGKEQGVLPLSSLPLHQKSKVVSIHTKDRKKLHKFMAMHVLPGMGITLIKNFPSYVFQIGHSQFAIDKELAKDILCE